MSTVYTVNGKVLKNAANDKWLAKKEAPAGFVMDASNAEIAFIESANQYYVTWEGPAYPSGYNGNGKQYILVNNNDTSFTTPGLVYSPSIGAGGPPAISSSDFFTQGTSTGVLSNNVAGGDYGKYFAMGCGGLTLEQAQAYFANVSITIVDP